MINPGTPLHYAYPLVLMSARMCVPASAKLYAHKPPCRNTMRPPAYVLPLVAPHRTVLPRDPYMLLYLIARHSLSIQYVSSLVSLPARHEHHYALTPLGELLMPRR